MVITEQWLWLGSRADFHSDSAVKQVQSRFIAEESALGSATGQYPQVSRYHCPSYSDHIHIQPQQCFHSQVEPLFTLLSLTYPAFLLLFLGICILATPNAWMAGDTIQAGDAVWWVLPPNPQLWRHKEGRADRLTICRQAETILQVISLYALLLLPLNKANTFIPYHSRLSFLFI